MHPAAGPGKNSAHQTSKESKNPGAGRSNEMAWPGPPHQRAWELLLMSHVRTGAVSSPASRLLVAVSSAPDPRRDSVVSEKAGLFSQLPGFDFCSK